MCARQQFITILRIFTHCTNSHLKNKNKHINALLSFKPTKKKKPKTNKNKISCNLVVHTGPNAQVPENPEPPQTPSEGPATHQGGQSSLRQAPLEQRPEPISAIPARMPHEPCHGKSSTEQWKKQLNWQGGPIQEDIDRPWVQSDSNDLACERLWAVQGTMESPDPPVQGHPVTDEDSLLRGFPVRLCNDPLWLHLVAQHRVPPQGSPPSTRKANPKPTAPQGQDHHCCLGCWAPPHHCAPLPIPTSSMCVVFCWIREVGWIWNAC